MGVFPYTWFLLKHEKGRMPKLVILIYSRADPQPPRWGLHVAPSCWGTLFPFSPRGTKGLELKLADQSPCSALVLFILRQPAAFCFFVLFLILLLILTQK